MCEKKIFDPVEIRSAHFSKYNIVLIICMQQGGKGREGARGINFHNFPQCVVIYPHGNIGKSVVETRR